MAGFPRLINTLAEEEEKWRRKKGGKEGKEEGEKKEEEEKGKAGECHGASCLQANDAEGRKNDRLKKEKEGKGI